jgi:hypothetical protein
LASQGRSLCDLVTPKSTGGTDAVMATSGSRAPWCRTRGATVFRPIGWSDRRRARRDCNGVPRRHEVKPPRTSRGTPRSDTVHARVSRRSSTAQSLATAMLTCPATQPTRVRRRPLRALADRRNPVATVALAHHQGAVRALEEGLRH